MECHHGSVMWASKMVALGFSRTLLSGYGQRVFLSLLRAEAVRGSSLGTYSAVEEGEISQVDYTNWAFGRQHKTVTL